MTKCTRCNRRIKDIPFKCKFCHKFYCSNHRLPESHRCQGLEEHKRHSRKKWFNVIGNSPSPKKEEHSSKKEIKETYKGEHPNNIKRFLRKRYHQFVYWLNDREHRRYRKWNAFFMNVLWVVIISVIISIIYSNLAKLNEIVLWIIPLGETLILVVAFFWIKYTWGLLKRLGRMYKGSKNWAKYLIIILVLVLLWQAYQNRDTVFDPAIELYDKLNLTYIFPLDSSFDWGVGITGDGTGFPYYKTNNLRYGFLDEELCLKDYGDRVHEGFQIISDATGNILNFTYAGVIDLQEQDTVHIMVLCHRNFESEEASGFGGPGEMYANGEIISTGTISILKHDPKFLRCNSYPSLEIHEILHALGFDHRSQGIMRLITEEYDLCPEMEDELAKCLMGIYSNGEQGISCENFPNLNAFNDY